MSLSRSEVEEIVKNAVKAALHPFEKQMGALEDSFQKLQRQRNLALGTAAICLIAASFSAGYGIQSHDQLVTANESLKEQTDTNQEQLCSAARSTALAYHEPLKSSSGRRESREHFLDRMIGQRDTLLRARNLECPSLPGFDTFAYLRGKAIIEIDDILREKAPPRLQKELGIPDKGHPDLGVEVPGTSPEATPESDTASSGGSAGSGPRQPGHDGGSGGSPNKPPKNESGSGGGGGKEGSPPKEEAGPPAPSSPGAGSEEGSGGGESGGGGGSESGQGSGTVGNVGDTVNEALCTVNKLTGLKVCPGQ